MKKFLILFLTVVVSQLGYSAEQIGLGQDNLGQALNTEISKQNKNLGYKSPDKPTVGGNFGPETYVEPLSKCLDGVKSISLKPGWGYLTDGKSFMLPPNTTIDYAYDKKTKTQSPVVTEFKDGKVAVSTPAGTTVIEGKSCIHESKTSVEKITEMILKSERNFEESKKFDPMSVGKMSPEAEKNYKEGSKRAENEYKQILTDCAKENLGSISESAKLILHNLFPGSSGKKASETNQGTR